ncbi:MAG: hypothetical protein AAF743_15505, partial [Planctomycetota bacterium]
MAGWRKIVVLVGVVGFVALSLVDMVTGDERWPFSPYEMFSRVERADSTTRYRAFGVDAAGNEFALTDADLKPFRVISVHVSASRLVRGDGGGEPALEQLVQTLADRAARKSDDDRLTAVRLYELTWPFDPHLANFDTPQRTLLVEVTPTRE